MKEVDKKDMPEISGGEVDAYGNPIAGAYPIYQVPGPSPDPFPVPESPCPEPRP